MSFRPQIQSCGKRFSVSAMTTGMAFPSIIPAGQAKNGVTVAVENVSRCKSASSSFIKEIKNMLGNEFAFVLDTKQAIRAGENPISFLDAAGDKTCHVHISDSGEMGDCLLIGRGRFNFRQFFEKLGGYSPDCAVILELYRSGFKGISDLVTSCSTLTKMAEQYGKGKDI